MALLVLAASFPMPERSAKAVAAPIEPSVKILYIILDPENFPNETNKEILTNSYQQFEERFNEKNRVRTRLQGDNYNTCVPEDACDRIVIQRHEQQISVTIICNKETKTSYFPAGEVRNLEEILGLLMQITIIVGAHDGQQHQ